MLCICLIWFIPLFIMFNYLIIGKFLYPWIYPYIPGMLCNRYDYPIIPLDTRLMAIVSMDMKEMPKSILGYTCILVCVCEYTNWVKAIPLVDQKSCTIADAIFFRIISEYGTPKAIICDEGPAFTSDLMKMYFHSMNIKPYYISQMNYGQIELKIHQNSEWTYYAEISQELEINGHYLCYPHVGLWTHVSQVTGYSPYEMVYHVEPPNLFNFDYKPGKQVLSLQQNNT